MERTIQSFMWSNNLQTLISTVINLVKGIRTNFKPIGGVNWNAKVWNDTGQENGNKLRAYKLYKSSLIAEDYVKINME